MKKIVIVSALMLGFSAVSHAADDVQLFPDELLVNDSETSAIEQQAEETVGETQSTGFFGFITRPLSKLFSDKGGEDEAAPSESYIDKLKRTADEGNGDSQLDLAYMYLYGTDEIEPDFDQAIKYYDMAATQNDPIALNNLGSLYFSGIGTKRDIPKSLMYFKKAADLGNDNAQINLAFIYLAGGKKDAERNKKAIEMFKLAKDNNNIAKFMLGYAYYTGFVVPQNYEEAFPLIKDAAEGDSQIDEAQLILAEMYANGRGTVQNFQNAINSYRAAVNQSNMEAAMMLGHIYSAGVMCEKNSIAAHTLFNIAASKNIQGAAELRDLLAQEMKYNELAKAQSSAQEYQSTPSELTSYIRQTYGENIRRYIDNNKP